MSTACTTWEKGMKQLLDVSCVNECGSQPLKAETDECMLHGALKTTACLHVRDMGRDELMTNPIHLRRDAGLCLFLLPVLQSIVHQNDVLAADHALQFVLQSQSMMKGVWAFSGFLGCAETHGRNTLKQLASTHHLGMSSCNSRSYAHAQQHRNIKPSKAYLSDNGQEYVQS